MAFTQSTFAPVSAHAANSPSVYSYSTQDNLETVLAVGYFIAKKFQLEESDFIDVTTPQGTIRTQVIPDTSTVNVSTNAIVSILAGSGSSSVDFNDVSWERATGIFQLSEIGSVYENAPFVISQPTEVYEVIVKTDKGSGILEQLMIVVDPNGLETRFFRAGTPESIVIGGGWSQLLSGLSNKGAVTTTDATPTTVYTYPTETGKTYSVEFFLTGAATVSGGAFGGKYYMLLQNIGGTVSLVAGLETIYRKRTTGGIGATVTVATNVATITVTGKAAQTWDWVVALITFEVVE